MKKISSFIHQKLFRFCGFCLFVFVRGGGWLWEEWRGLREWNKNRNLYFEYLCKKRKRRKEISSRSRFSYSRVGWYILLLFICITQIIFRNVESSRFRYIFNRIFLIIKPIRLFLGQRFNNSIQYILLWVLQHSIQIKQRWRRRWIKKENVKFITKFFILLEFSFPFSCFSRELKFDKSKRFSISFRRFIPFPANY